MSKRFNKHTAKTLQHRTVYIQGVERVNTEATVDEQADFNSTTKVGPDTARSKSKYRRPVKWYRRLQNHFSAHVIEYVIFVIGTVLLFLVMDARGDIKFVLNTIPQQNAQFDRLHTEIDNLNDQQDEATNRLQDSINKSDDENDQQNILLAEIMTRLENLEKLFSENK